MILILILILWLQCRRFILRHIQRFNPALTTPLPLPLLLLLLPPPLILLLLPPLPARTGDTTILPKE